MFRLDKLNFRPNQRSIFRFNNYFNISVRSSKDEDLN